jgi:hypothetical protein
MLIANAVLGVIDLAMSTVAAVATGGTATAKALALAAFGSQRIL